MENLEEHLAHWPSIGSPREESTWHWKNAGINLAVNFYPMLHHRRTRTRIVKLLVDLSGRSRAYERIARPQMTERSEHLVSRRVQLVRSVVRSRS